MKRTLTVSFLLFGLLALLGTASPLFAAPFVPTMNEYCQSPPVVTQAAQPNVLFVLDVSGSMSNAGYSFGDRDNNGDGILDGYNPNTTYEGYFTPEKMYTQDAGGIWMETTPTGVPCTRTCTAGRCRNNSSGSECSRPTATCGNTRWYCCTTYQNSGDCGLTTGNYLNYVHMARIDLLRWALTGGSPSTCTGAQAFNNGQCDPELWADTGNATKVGTVCNDSLVIGGTSPNGGCILMANDGTQVKVPWARVYDGLAFQFKNLGVQPRMGAMFYDSSSVRAQKVYVGDFTAPNSTSTANPFMNLITHVNSHDPGGTTPTGPAMWDALNYFAQNPAKFGGFTPQSGAGDRWKNPMYICDGGGANCQSVPCAGNFVILMSDGQWNNSGSGTNCNIGNNRDCAAEVSPDPVVPAYCMHMGFKNVAMNPQVNTSVKAVYSIGLFLGGSGEKALQNVALYGSFSNTSSHIWPGNLSGYPTASCNLVPMELCNTGSGSYCASMPPSAGDWDKDGNGLPDTFFNASDALGIKTTLMDAILDILRRTASGTAVSVLASGEGSGANMLQALFYPRKVFDNTEKTELSWIGEMQNLWYYLDPTLGNSSIREDTTQDGQLNLLQDYALAFYFSGDKTLAKRYTSDATGNLTYFDEVNIDNVKNLWEAGQKLWAKDVLARRLYTNAPGCSILAGQNLTDFKTSAACGSMQSYLNIPAINAPLLVSYVSGNEVAGARTRLLADPSLPPYDATARSWKLGDIINSTPKIESWVRLNTYDSPSPMGYGDTSYESYLASADYKNRGMVYVGANDGMLHAFELGTLVEIDNRVTPALKARLDGATRGDEAWAFIPKNVLPYLQYLADPNYCHIYYVDATPFLFDASIGTNGCASGNYWDCPKHTDGTTWRTILIGGMGLGGACRDTASACTDCVKTPQSGNGYSSYFALDVTNPQYPKLLWEFSHPELGFTLTGPAVVRVGARTGTGTVDNNKNGRWLAVFGSGPTGPINTATHQFMGKSDQNLKIFVVDVATGQLATAQPINTGITNAFAGSIIGNMVDVDRRFTTHDGYYQDDVVHIGYTKESAAGSGTWTGGVIRLATNESLNANTWTASTLIQTNTPITGGLGHLVDNKTHNMWVYFGTGRYFFKSDDPSVQQRLYAVKDPCLNATTKVYDGTCTTTVGVASLNNATITPPITEPAAGWYIDLDPCTDALGNTVACGAAAYGSERVITSTLAAPNGNVFFTTFKPTTDICGFGGNTQLWAVNYTTGGQINPSTAKGKALIQLSTGSIEQIDLGEAFGGGSGGAFGTPPPAYSKNWRRSGSFTGIPPTGQGLAIVTNPAPIKKLYQLRER